MLSSVGFGWSLASAISCAAACGPTANVLPSRITSARSPFTQIGKVACSSLRPPKRWAISETVVAFFNQTVAATSGGSPGERKTNENKTSSIWLGGKRHASAICRSAHAESGARQRRSSSLRDGRSAPAEVAALHSSAGRKCTTTRTPAGASSKRIGRGRTSKVLGPRSKAEERSGSWTVATRAFATTFSAKEVDGKGGVGPPRFAKRSQAKMIATSRIPKTTPPGINNRPSRRRRLPAPTPGPPRPCTAPPAPSGERLSKTSSSLGSETGPL